MAIIRIYNENVWGFVRGTNEVEETANDLNVNP